VRAWHSGIAEAHPTTAAKAYRLLATMMRSAVADRIIAATPCDVRGASVEKAPERPVASIAEVAALAEAMPEHLRLVVLLAAWCQLRRGELLGLRRRDLDLLHGTLTVEVTRTPTMRGEMIEKAPKTDAGARTIAMPSNILPAVVDHLARFTAPGADARVLVGMRGAALTPNVLGDAWVRARASVGRTDLRVHDLRHSGLTWSAATGATMAELMRRAGHASPAAAIRYQHATDDCDKALAMALAGLAEPAPVEVLTPRTADISRTTGALASG